LNGVHDMGGMQGFGPVAPEADEPLFHAPWEARVLALSLTTGAGRWNIDAGRHAIERIAPADYLAMSYYEKWLRRIEMLAVERGLLTAEELRTATPSGPRLTPALSADRVPAVLSSGSPYQRPVQAPARFEVGQCVRARNLNPAGHTRLPRYARGKAGVIHAHRGAHVFPDSNAHFRGEDPHHLYTVRFSARELWGEDAPGRDSVFLELWEPYLEPA
jgi:nitrile hydratase